MKLRRITIALVALGLLVPVAGAQAHTLLVKLRLTGTVLTISGSLKPDNLNTHQVHVLVKHGKHTVFGMETTLDAHGRFSISVSPVSNKSAITVQVRIGSLHVKHAIPRSPSRR